MIVGCYSLHLYCDTEGAWKSGGSHGFSNAGFMEFTGKTEADCKRQARQAGWRFSHERQAFCPQCNKRKS